jgi:hypothetical protein
MEELMDIDSSFEYRGISLVETCSACPEQYDAFDGRGRQVGYLRLRHGYFTVDAPVCGGSRIYEASSIGDGIFHSSEREKFLCAAIDAIKAI